MLRRVLGVVGIASVLLAAPLSAASAADMPYKAPPYLPPAAPAAYSWTGCYVDAGAGYGFWNQDHYTAGPALGTILTTSSTTDGGRGWLGRFGGGCDYQTPWFNNRFVVGVFGDYDPMSLTGSNSPSQVGEVPCPTFCTSTLTASERETNAWYVGGRIGYLVNPTFLAFVDGGYTQTRFVQSGQFETVLGEAVGIGFPNFTDSGWFIGGGGEYALDWFPIRGFFVKGEYRYAQYNSLSLTETFTGGGSTGFVETTKPYVQTITGSLVWRFNWAGR